MIMESFRVSFFLFSFWKYNGKPLQAYLNKIYSILAHTTALFEYYGGNIKSCGWGWWPNCKRRELYYTKYIGVNVKWQ